MTFWGAIWQIIQWIFFVLIIAMEVADMNLSYESLKSKGEDNFGAILVTFVVKIYVISILIRFLFLK